MRTKTENPAQTAARLAHGSPFSVAQVSYLLRCAKGRDQLVRFNIALAIAESLPFDTVVDLVNGDSLNAIAAENEEREI